MDFTRLTPQEFETLCARLLQASGYQLTSQPGKSRDIGVDFTFTDEAGASWVAEVKHFRRPRTGTTVLRQASQQLNFARGFVGASHALLIISMLLPQATKRAMEVQEEVQVWDLRDLNERLAIRPDIGRDFQALINAQAATQAGLNQPPTLEARALELITRLDALPSGRTHWRQYEDLCAEILNYAFFPGLGVPSLQSRSDDGLDIRDAVFTISREDAFWSEIREICRTRFVVAEFKNYSEPIRQTEVESIQQYLYVKARRMFGLLCSRQQPSESATLARRRAWVEHDRLILFLSDEDLKDLVRARAFGEQPTAALDVQLDGFLLTLNP